MNHFLSLINKVSKEICKLRGIDFEFSINNVVHFNAELLDFSELLYLETSVGPLSDDFIKIVRVVLWVQLLVGDLGYSGDFILFLVFFS